MKRINPLFDKLRCIQWLLLALFFTMLLAFSEPYQLVVLVWELAKLCIAVFLGYWIDRSIFFYARPGHYHPRKGSADEVTARALLMLRRAIIMGATILALGLGV